jgi:ABC-2 type transport system permease protein
VNASLPSRRPTPGFAGSVSGGRRARLPHVGLSSRTNDGCLFTWDLLPGWAYSLLWAVMFAGISLLIASLTGKQAFAAGGIVAVFMMTVPVVGVLASLPNTTANSLSGLTSPTFLIGGVGEWLTERESQLDVGVGTFGAIYGIEAACLVTACFLLLLARYRKVASR